MRRYDGIDELLQGVRERLEAGYARASQAKSDSLFTVETPVQGEDYDSLVGSLGVLLREAEQLREMVTPDGSRRLSEEQRDRILTLLGQVLEELWTCEAALQGVK